MSMAEGESGQPQQQNLVEIVTGIRRRVGAYQKLWEANPKADMGFVIKYLSNLFDNENELKTDGSILLKIKPVYEVYCEMREWSKEEAPIVLMQNLRDILRDDSLPLPSENSGVKEPEACLIQQELKLCDPSINVNDAMSLDEASKFNYKCSYCPREFHHKKEWKTHKKFHMGQGNFFSCTFCKRPFAQLKSKEFHEVNCFKTLSQNQNGNIDEQEQEQLPPPSSLSVSSSSPSASSFSPSVNKKESISPYSTRAASKTTTTTDDSVQTQVLLSSNQNVNPTGENEHQMMETGESSNQKENEDTNDESLDEMLSRVISTANQSTLISSGASISLFGEGSVYRCHLCKDGQPHGSTESLSDHIRRHNGQRPFSCPHSACNRSYSDSVSFKIHVKRPHLENGQVESPPKSRSKSRSRSLVKRSSSDNKERRKSRVCPYCDKRLSPNTSVGKHIMTHMGEMPHACDLCPARFAYSSARSYHMKQHHQPRQESSLNINSDLPSIKQEPAASENGNININMENSMEIKMELNENDSTFVENLKLLPEKRVRHPNSWTATGYDTDTKDSDPDYQPSIYDSLPPARPPRKRSRKQNTDGGDASTNNNNNNNGGGGVLTRKVFKCIYCNKSYGNKGHLIAHVRGHVKEEGEKNPLACRLCDRKFDDSGSRAFHEFVDHTKNDQFYCQTCGRSYSTVTHLVAHGLVHTS